MVRRGADVALVLPAAGGKTLLLILLMRVTALGVIIVILLFWALLDGMARPCQQHDVPYGTWTMASSRDNNCQLVLVTAEQALQPEFGAWTTRLHLQRHEQLADKTHKPLLTELSAPPSSNVRPLSSN